MIVCLCYFTHLLILIIHTRWRWKNILLIKKCNIVESSVLFLYIGDGNDDDGPGHRDAECEGDGDG